MDTENIATDIVFILKGVAIETYFSKFPTITYDSFQTRDITERVKMVQPDTMVPENYYPYEIQNGMRADTIANQYYGDSNLDWLIYLTNNMTDPYYDWNLSTSDFESYLNIKYGSVPFSQQIVAFYRTNWANDPAPISISYYTSLSQNLKKYYQPLWGDTKIVGYFRRQEDWTMSTNQIINFSANMSSNAVFTSGDPLQLFSNGQAYGTVQVIFANSSLFTAQHIITNQQISANDVAMSLSNNLVNCHITSTTLITQNISNEEAAYWEPVFYYDVENEKNTTHRFIELLESNFALQTSEKIRKALQN